ncbi:MAG TPA: DUF5343 domain-containing protein [Chloroflexota bacterium]|nr:DUF5343 domain-containing protein [Chloroflexota bacterium]
MAVARAKTYPRFGANVWWELRDAMRKERPEAVDVPYLIGQLGQSEKSARNLLPNFRALGLIDDTGRPTELADHWCTDATYPGALDEMVRRSYAEVAHQFPTPPSDRSALEEWFAATTGTGENSVRQMASFYMLLTTKDAPAIDGSAEVASASDTSASTEAAAESAPAEPAPAAAESLAEVPVPVETVREPVSNHVPADSSAASPVLHLHLHFAPDTSEAKVEALLRSVKKYL